MMKRLLLLTVSLLVLVSCNGRKQIEQALHSGNYDQAITNALKKFKNNKDKKRKQQFVVMLEDAYNKVVERDLNTIRHLQKDGNPEHYKAIYEIYMDLNARQEAIKPVLPLKVGSKYVSLNFNDYSTEIVESRANVSDFMYEKGIAQLEFNDKQIIREAYHTFKYIERINPNYDDTREFLKEAHQRGTDYVMVSITNKTQQVIPQRLEDDLLNFDTYGLDQFWTVYHANNNTDIVYDYVMELQLKRINISPEKLYKKQLLREKRIVDGWEYLLDTNGNVAKDSLGNDIKVDKIINVKARYFKFNQFKSTQVIADVVYTDLKSNQTMDSFPIDSEFVFENNYARFRGDKRALNRRDKDLLDHRHIHFPTDAQMVYDTGEDLKLQLKAIINSYRIRS